jgi:Holliday junction resolvase
MNKNYVNGRAKEYRIKKKLESEGWIVLRTAGSHGFADLIAIDKLCKVIKFVQCKPNNFSEKEKEKIKNDCSFLNCVFRTEFEVI